MNYAIVHISDIHFLKDKPESASTVINALIKDLKTQTNDLHNYTILLAITGDVVSQGTDVEAYNSFFSEFDGKFNKIKISRDNRIIVPGNHDIDREILKENLQEYQKLLYQKMQNEEVFNDFLYAEGLKANLFENYLLFDSDFAQYGLDYNPLGKGWTIDDEFGVYCLNSALCSFGGLEKIKDKNKLAINTRGLIDWCLKTKTKNNILLMHHPINHLTKWHKNELKQIIEKYFFLCLCGHDHEQDLYYNKISNKSLICTVSQLFTKKDDLLGYSIIHIERNFVEKIQYRQYLNGKFLNGSAFSGNNEGVICLPNNHSKCLEFLDIQLYNALSFFKNQPVVFIEPKLSKEREFNNEANLLDEIISEPKSTIITAHPQFGLTCLSHHMRLKAFKDNKFWIYLDAKHIKTRHIETKVQEQLAFFDKTFDDIQCIIIDSWDSSIVDNRNIFKSVDEDYKDIPIIVMTNYSEQHFNSDFNFSELNRKYDFIHLQALQRNKVREFVCKYNKVQNIEKEDLVVSKVVKDLEALNVHRTPANCLTLLKVFERNFNEDLVNRTKMLQAALFILFTDSDSFTYASDRPDVEDCEYIIGRFCKTLILKRVRRFSSLEFLIELRKYCKESLRTVNIDILVDILESNKILIKYKDDFEFKHSCWIYYFAATYMHHDKVFRDYILENREYVNFPEMIEFYTGIDGKRTDAIKILLRDLKELNETVDCKIGIPGDFNPFSQIVWKPSDGTIEAIRKEISEKVQQSNLPTDIKDQAADQCYNSETPYNQSIHQLLNEYSVISLFQGIKASSRALRNSSYISTELKKEMMKMILNAWEQVSRVFFWLTPVLAQNQKANFEGLALFLFGFNKEDSCENLLKKIFEANPYNVVSLFKDDLSSKKIGPLLFEFLKNKEPEIQRHFLAHFLIRERPIGWYTELFDFMNLLHRNSFYLGDLYDVLNHEIQKGFVSNSDLKDLQKIAYIIIAKHQTGPKEKIENINAIPSNMTINEENKLPIDKILALRKTAKYFKKK
jgi:predicted MPP superfamily phosphohydrolase